MRNINAKILTPFEQTFADIEAAHKEMDLVRMENAYNQSLRLFLQFIETLGDDPKEDTTGVAEVLTTLRKRLNRLWRRKRKLDAANYLAGLLTTYLVSAGALTPASDDAAALSPASTSNTPPHARALVKFLVDEQHISVSDLYQHATEIKYDTWQNGLAISNPATLNSIIHGNLVHTKMSDDENDKSRIFESFAAPLIERQLHGHLYVLHLPRWKALLPALDAVDADVFVSWMKQMAPTLSTAHILELYGISKHSGAPFMHWLRGFRDINWALPLSRLVEYGLDTYSVRTLVTAAETNPHILRQYADVKAVFNYFHADPDVSYIWERVIGLTELLPSSLFAGQPIHPPSPANITLASVAQQKRIGKTALLRVAAWAAMALRGYETDPDVPFQRLKTEILRLLFTGKIDAGVLRLKKHSLNALERRGLVEGNDVKLASSAAPLVSGAGLWKGTSDHDTPFLVCARPLQGSDDDAPGGILRAFPSFEDAYAYMREAQAGNAALVFHVCLAGSPETEAAELLDKLGENPLRGTRGKRTTETEADGLPLSGRENSASCLSV